MAWKYCFTFILLSATIKTFWHSVFTAQVSTNQKAPTACRDSLHSDADACNVRLFVRLLLGLLLKRLCLGTVWQYILADLWARQYSLKLKYLAVKSNACTPLVNVLVLDLDQQTSRQVPDVLRCWWVLYARGCLQWQHSNIYTRLSLVWVFGHKSTGSGHI